MEIEVPRNPEGGEIRLPKNRVGNELPPFLEDAPLAFRRGSSSRRRGSVPAWSIVAGVIDLLVVTAFWSFALLFAMWAFKATGLRIHSFPLESLALYMLGQYSCYFLIFRVFAGFTIGEWACGLRLGEARHRLADDYALRVLGRFLIVALTGFVTLPILSVILGRDLAGHWAGLPLVAQQS